MTTITDTLPSETRDAFEEFCRDGNLDGTDGELQDWLADYCERCCMTGKLYVRDLMVKLSDDEWCLDELEDEAEAEIRAEAGSGRYSNSDCE